MKAIIPLAGKGTRLRPITHHTPKALVQVAGRPALGFILDALIEGGVDEMVFIVGHLREDVEAWIGEHYPELRTHYVFQEVQDGTAGAVALAEPYVDEEVLIVFADAIMEVDYGAIAELDAADSGLIWALEVEDYYKYGVILTDETGAMERIVEKPSEPISKLANIGLYYIRDYQLLFEGIHHTLDAGLGPSGEFFLTDAFQYMVDHGARIIPAPVNGFFDCGKPETLLDTNEHLLLEGQAGIDSTANVDGAEIVQPVRLEADVVVKGGRIGPNVTLGAGTTVDGCEVERSLVGAGSVLARSKLINSILGVRVRVEDFSGSAIVTDDSVLTGRD
jgi:glucose-1-phosphate thymidylyltransferase